MEILKSQSNIFKILKNPKESFQTPRPNWKNPSNSQIILKKSNKILKNPILSQRIQWIPMDLSILLIYSILTILAGRIRGTCRMWARRPANCSTRCTGRCWMRRKSVRMPTGKRDPCPEILTPTASTSPASR